ncbi:MAG: N-acetylmuramoyl-L-alanine amidase [Firmicutes bacterium]|nr:N-acetylmuramoyl-L-alanine amidase [Bacillota bacterium]
MRRVTALRRRAAAILMILALAGAGTATRAEVGTAASASQDYRDAQYVQVNLGAANVESGLRLLVQQPDGQSQPVPEGSGRQTSSPPDGAECFFYFDVDNTYINGGSNKVTMTVQYLDAGLTPIYLEYDSFDPLRPDAQTDDVARKRVLLVNRTNSEALKSAYITLADARFGGHLPGGADFRIGSGTNLVVTNVSVLRVQHQEPAAPVQLFLDGTRLTFAPDEVQPFVHPVSGRTLVPFRAMFGALGISDDQIKWYSESRTVEARRGQTTIRLAIDSDMAAVNGVPLRLEQPAAIVAGRTVVPLRFVAEQFGLQVETPRWDQTARIIRLVSPQPPASDQPALP